MSHRSGLDGLLTLRAEALRQQQAALARGLAEEANRRERLAVLQAQQTQAEAARREAQSGQLSLHSLPRLREAAARLRAAVAAAEDSVRRQSIANEKTRTHLMEATRENRLLEQLQDRRRQEQSRLLARREDRAADELSTLRAGRPE